MVLINILAAFLAVSHADSRTKACARIERALERIAYADPDAYDSITLSEQGAVQYLCFLDGEYAPDKHARRACGEALRLKCL